MNTAGIVSIVVALITLTGSLLLHWLQFRKDSNTIGSVKSDTCEMKPQVSMINSGVEEIKQDVIRNILPKIQKLDNVDNGVDRLIVEMEYQQRLKKEISPDVLPKDYFMAELDQLYIKIGSLEERLRQEQLKYKELEQSYLIAMLENNKLKEKPKEKDRSQKRGIER